MAARTAAARPPREDAAQATAETVAPAHGGVRGWLARHWWALLLLIGATWGFLWPFSRRPWSGLASWGDPVQQYWSMAWTVHALRTDPMQLWNGNIFYPYPNTLAYADHLLGATIPVLPVILITGNLVLAFNLAVIFACFLSALSAYLLIADLTGSRLAGMAAALPFGFAPYLLGQMNHLNVLFAGPIALACWATLRLWRGGGWGWAALLALAIPWEAAVSAYFFYAQLIGIGTALLYLLIAERRGITRRMLPRLGVGLIVGLLAAVPVLWPYLQITREFGSVRTFDEVLQWSGLPRQYLGVTNNNLTWYSLLKQWSGGNPERFLFPGLVAPVLALVGLILSRRRERWLFAALIAVGFTLTMGPYQEIGDWRVPLPYLLLYRTVPGFSGMRVTTRFVILVILGLAGLAGLGVEALIRRWQGRGVPRRRKGGKARAGMLSVPILPADGMRREVQPLLGVAVLVVLLGAYGVDYRTHSGMTSPPGGAIEAPAYGWLAANGQGPVAELPYPLVGQPPALPDLIATAHWRPIIGGFSGFEPPAFNELVGVLNQFPAPAAVELLQGLAVEHILVHRADLSDERLAAFDRALASETRVREVARFGDDAIYALVSDPWLARIVAAVPAGEAVVLPDIAGDGLRQELLTVFLREAGHTVWGSGAVDYHRFSLPDDGQLPASAVLPASADPYLHGWLPEEKMLSVGGLTLYRHAPGTRAATLLNDQALPRTTCPNCPALGFRLTESGIATIGADQASGAVGGGAGRAALLAFVNTVPGEITIRAGGAERRVQVPAGLVVYRTGVLATDATVRIDAPSGGALTPRWVRLDDGASGQAGVIATRPVVMVTATVREQGAGKVALSAAVFAGAGGDQGAYALSLDIYQRPYGTHPDGHYGYWTIGVPADDRAHRAEMSFDIATRAADATLDGAWTPISSWSGPPTSGPFRASLVVARGEAIVGSLPLFEFELRAWQARYVEYTLPGDRVYFFASER
ncbi:MAG: hypothetical protein U0841_27935 [Chloroflexia bacterium]